jgi:signal transduction histidine kinase
LHDGQLPQGYDQETVTLELPHDETPRESLDRLRREIAELRASRERLVLAADADRRTIERDLHEGVQQHLVALAVKLQLAAQLIDADPAAAIALYAEMERDVQQALDETARLAQRIYLPLLETALAAALRAALVDSGIPASVDVTAEASCPPEVARTVYLCCLETLEHIGAGARATVKVRGDESALSFEVVGESAGSSAAIRSDEGLDLIRDRVEALGGQLTIRSKPGGGIRVSGSLPLVRRR